MGTTRPPIAVGIGLVIVAAGMAALVHGHPEQLKAPAWVVFTALGLFGLAGRCLVGQALRLEGLVRWLVCVLLGAMIIVPGWIAFGSGPRQCTTLAFGARIATSEVVCRGAFGAGALILVIMFAIAVRGAVRATPSL
ncbi:hypothetical protein DWG18_01410 [Lysobacter sp. TY2-98]|uniref:hypothetical protein n=1 Tax=Lysobacter sp. TY2-98 TaxID=2290922 RepID=UPI000E1FEC64|nr:hypothetical protein [Lysobacter sp. TY2-98]AXK71073.1 hypothetical protein DWG18_01410 [Lysobacter sp. TY2-98]